MAEQATQRRAEVGGERLEQGAYEIIRNRLVSQAAELRKRLDELNTARKEVFGSIETRLIATDRITTEHNCIPRDMVAVGERFLFGYNVQFGLRSVTNVEDVFAVYRLDENNSFHPEPMELLRDERFEKDFRDLYRFYKGARFAKFFVRGPHLYMKFHVGDPGRAGSIDDFKAFKWLIDGDALRYVDARSDHEVRYPPQHEFEWKRAGRDHQRLGAHPHVSIEDKVFVETVGGDLTIKVEDNTATGAGIFTEPVDNADQSLDDAEFHYAVLGHLILLRVRPYQERASRYFVFNEKLKEVVRVDAIADACVLLPDDHGIVFSNGYYLATGERVVFPHDPGALVFDRRIASPNGEDTLFVFYRRERGEYVLLSYNVIERKVETPILCHGFTVFTDGKMVYFRVPGGGGGGGEQPQKHHQLQVWQTPYVGANYVPDRRSDSMLFKIGNRDIVRAMAECVEVLTLVDRDEAYAEVYVDIVRATTAIVDAYFWLGKPDAMDLADVLRQIKATAQSAVGEFEKVMRIRKATRDRVADVTRRARDLITANATRVYDDIHGYVRALAGLREVRGEIIGLRELRYVDLDAVAALEADIEKQGDEISRKTVAYLLKRDSLDPYRHSAAEFGEKVDELERVTDAKALEKRISDASRELEMLIEIVGNLRIEDANQRTAIIDGISAIFSTLNTARSRLRNRTQELARGEGIAEFNSQLKLLGQSVVNYLDIADTPAKVEELLTRVMVQIEELEGRFAEFDEFVLQLSEKREEVYNAFENRKVALVEARNRRTNALAQAADRILGGVKARVDNLGSIAEIDGYFATDLMIDKVRDITRELGELDDTVKVDDIQSRLKTIREDAVRQLKDRAELFEDGNVIRFGRHRFSVNPQAVDLTTILRDGVMHLHLSGTNFFEPIRDEALEATRDVWNQQVVSENREVYRGEYLAYLMFTSQGRGSEATPTSGDLEAVQRFMAPRYTEGYTKGVHDHDAAIILRALLELDASSGLLRYPPSARALATLFWRTFDDPRRELILGKLDGFGSVAQVFPDSTQQRRYTAELRTLLAAYVESHRHFDHELLDDAAAYLFAELTGEHRRSQGFVSSPEAARLHEAFESHLKQHRQHRDFEASLDGVQSDPFSVFLLAHDWVTAFRESSDDFADASWAEYVDEVAFLLFEQRVSPGNPTRLIESSVRRELEGLVGSHGRIDGGRMPLHFNEFMQRLGRFARHVVPRFQAYTRLKHDIVERARDEMRLDEFKPRVLTSFVRNKLIDEVYLPLIGDNLAKQLGTAGDSKRTDRQGMLLVISPPGYGKTTLMEYVANRLGLIFMKVNGPAIGHGVTSLDPAEAPNAAAREEMQKLNLALEMGDNVMLYVDDIQHTNPEFLQKFISLCDAQRRIEGVYKGRTRTYDLRGRKVAVVMAGNPYTESGGKFQIPDMLANRADTYNLGDILGDHRRSFELSYIENCLTSNPTLQRLASRSQKDVHAIIRFAESGSREGVEFEGNYDATEVGEMVEVMKKLLKVRDIVLRVNQQYIASAGQDDQYRTEPNFLLQGSYRNMNRIAERIVPIMNDDELRTLIVSAYEQDAQTLTRGAEANLLKFKELMGILSDAERERWEEIKRTFQRNNAVRALGGDDKTAAVLSQLAGFNQNLGDIREAIRTVAERNGSDQPAARAAGGDDRLAPLVERIDGLRGVLEAGIARLAEARDADRAMDAEPVRPQTARAEPQEIRVVNKVPSTFLYVMKEQFELMKNWLEPLTRITADQDEQLKQVRTAIEGLVDRYDRTIRHLERTGTGNGPEVGVEDGN